MDASTILAGGRMVQVTFIDGRTEGVKVRQLPIRLLTQYDVKQTDEPALVELFCEKEKDWADTLTHESYEEIVNVGDEINKLPFERYTRRLADRVEMMRGTRQVYVDAGVLPPLAQPVGGLVMPAISAAPVTTTDPALTTPSAPSAPAASSPQTDAPST